MKARTAGWLALTIALGCGGEGARRRAAEERCARGIGEACLSAAAFQTDPAKAAPFLRSACRIGVAEGCLKALGGDLTRACGGDNALLCTTLVDNYLRDKKPDLALAALARICQGGSPAACARRLALQGSGCREGLRAACQAISEECSGGDLASCRFLHNHYRARCREGDRTACPHSHEAGQAACNLGDQTSCQALADDLQGECAGHDPDACGAYRSFVVGACGRGLTWACERLEHADLTACRNSDVEACGRLNSGCEIRDSPECAGLGSLIFEVCENTPSACGILERRCQAGEKQSCAWIIIGYDTACKRGQKAGCEAMVRLCHEGNEEACGVANIRRLN
jgi:hypothetical protein